MPVAEQSTRVELSVGYRLTGTLAQFSRSDLIQDIASQLIVLFAHNLEFKVDRASASRATGAGTQGVSAAVSVLLKRISSRWKRLFTRDDRP